MDDFKRKTGWPMRQQLVEWGLRPCAHRDCKVLTNPAVLDARYCQRHRHKH